MTYKYNIFQIFCKRIWRFFFPIAKSPYTVGAVDDICSIHLTPPEKLQKFFVQGIQKLQKIRGKDIGAYLEFGVFNGNSLGSMYLATKQAKLGDIQLYAFDAFQGLPEGTDEEHDVLQKGFYTCPFEKTKECLMKRNIDPDEIVWIKGWYRDTFHKETIKKYNIKNIGIVFVDCDTYSSSKMVLDFLAPLIIEPIIICFDDWKLYDMDIKGTGEYKAFNEFLEDNPQFQVKEITSYNRKSKSFVISLGERKG